MEDNSNPKEIGAVIEAIEGKTVYVRVSGTDDSLALDRQLITSQGLRKGEILCLEGERLPTGDYSITKAYRVELDPPLDPATLERLRTQARREIGPELPELPPIKDE